MAHTIDKSSILNRETTASTSSDKLTQFYEYAEFNRYGIYAVLCIWSFCLGGIAVGLGGMSSVFELSALVITAMTLLSLILSVQPMKYVMWVAAIGTVINSIFILSHLV